MSTLEKALTAIETREVQSLSWGFVDGGLSREEAVAAVAASGAEDPQAVLRQLRAAHLIRVSGTVEAPIIRSRFAETVRLLARLRQWFGGSDWRSAARLVSDFRIDVRQRRYPRRNIAQDEAASNIEAVVASPLRHAVWSALAPADLSQFQVDAAMRLLGVPGESGSIITAGTGSGKTLAFYLPAFVALADGLGAASYWTRTLALYPRKELLKDQLAEVHAMACASATVLRQAGRRAVRVGALYGDTPRLANEKSCQDAGWAKASSGLICPFIRCPESGCDAPMVWRIDDLAKKHERLCCTRPSCRGSTDPEILPLTRFSLERRPADFLFTTTEMMNQRLSDGSMRRLFGAGVPVERQPLFVLLDEVHTYSGITGAQTALLLRRWRYLTGAAVRWVGLSATLRDARGFFSDLTGLHADAVAEITPVDEDMEAEGGEYQVLLRSDPTSQAATLSTSIQASMLLARMLDPPPPDNEASPSGGLFGRRLFAFTDELDVVNRLYDSLMDAEAYKPNRRPDPRRRPLAALRSSQEPERDERENEGQRWRMAEQLRQDLANPLIIGRTSSRDPGVDGSADVIVATAALEVGFNDPEVGAVLQHKAPRDVASFLQRRGRAGRRRGMRPLTVTVLSDYGRDRVAFQNYETLFDPIVERQQLPVRNTTVLRMQAVYALFDWLVARASVAGAEGWAWRALASPADHDPELRRHAARLLQDLVYLNPAILDDFRRFLRGSLKIDDATLDIVLWEPPRAVLLEAVPTLYRRLRTGWKKVGGGVDLYADRHPLPDFIPRSLFADLNLPEVAIVIPPEFPEQPETLETMRIVQALQDFVPGRVRRRFAEGWGQLSHWFPLDPEQPDQALPIASYAAQSELVGHFQPAGEAAAVLPVFRPWRINLARTDGMLVRPNSNATWRWASAFEVRGEGHIVRTPERSPWAAMLPELRIHLHRFGAAVSVCRFASTARADIRTKDGSRTVKVRLVDESGAAAAVGFEYEADAIVLPFQLPDRGRLDWQTLPPDLRHWLVALRSREILSQDPDLPDDLNPFQRDWLQQAFLIAAIRHGRSTGHILLDAMRDPVLVSDAELVGQAIRDLLDSLSDAENGGASETDNADDGPVEPGMTRLERTLRDCLQRPGVLPRLASAAYECLSGQGADMWTARLVSNTIAEATAEALAIAAPANTSADDLLVDFVQGEAGGHIYVVESSLGGGGTVEALAESFSAEPRAFFRALEAALAPRDLEAAADELQRVVAMAQDETVAAAFDRFRNAGDHAGREAARREIVTVLTSRGVAMSHALSVALATRILRPGSSRITDLLVRDLLTRWAELESQAGVALTVRQAAVLLADEHDLSERLRAAAGAGRERYAAGLLLWAKGGELRCRALQSYNPFRIAPLTDAATVRALLLRRDVVEVRFGDAEWMAAALTALSANGQVRVVVSAEALSAWYDHLVGLQTCPVESGFLRFYPVLETASRHGTGDWSFDLALRERA